MLRLLFSCLLLCATSLVIGQKTLDTGVVIFELTNIESADEDTQSQMEMLKGSTTKIAFTQEYALLEMNMMEGLMSMKTIKSLKNGETKMYLDMMGNKFVVPMSKEERDELAKNKDGQEVEWDVTYDKSDTKMIADYKCYKASVTNSDNNVTIECYLSPDVNADTKLLYGFEGFELDGFPMEYSTGDDGNGMTYTATSVNAQVDEKDFQVDEKAYTKMAFGDFAKMSEGMGSGMGF